MAFFLTVYIDPKLELGPLAPRVADVLALE